MDNRWRRRYWLVIRVIKSNVYKMHYVFSHLVQTCLLLLIALYLWQPDRRWSLRCEDGKRGTGDSGWTLRAGSPLPSWQLGQAEVSTWLAHSAKILKHQVKNKIKQLLLFAIWNKNIWDKTCVCILSIPLILICKYMKILQKSKNGF